MGAQDNVTQPFEDVLPYERFSVRVAEADIARLPQILAALSDAKRKDMRLQAGCAWRAMVSELGDAKSSLGDAKSSLGDTIELAG
jgi:hypothetical protein